MTTFNLHEYYVNLWGAFIGFLYLISSNADTSEKRKNFYLSIWGALKGFCVSLALTSAICDVLGNAKVFNETLFSDSVRAAFAFVICVNHKKSINYIYRKFLIKKEREDENFE